MSAKAADTPDCTARQARILELVVREYIVTALPVSSGRLVRRYGLAVSAATVRNELASLEELGLLTHPHTSAGRVPTVVGYRYFVENLMTNARMPGHEKRTIRHQFHQAGWDPERWMQLSAAVIAQTSGAAGLVAAPWGQRAPMRRLEIVDLGDGLVQILAVTASGFVRQARWRPGEAFDQAALDRISGHVNQILVMTGAPPDSAPLGAGRLEEEGLAAVRELLSRSSQPISPRLYHAGLTQIMHEPEFADSEHLRGVLEILEHGHGLEPILARLPGSGVQVIIGGESPLERVPHVTLVLARFGRHSGQGGVLGVVGPTRLPYERAVSAVGFVAQLMTQLLTGEAELGT